MLTALTDGGAPGIARLRAVRVQLAAGKLATIIKARPALASISAVGRGLRRELLRDSSEAEIRACVRLLGRLKTRLQPLADPLAAETRVPPRLVAAE